MSTQIMKNSHNGAPRVVWCGYRDWSDRLLELVREGGKAEIVACFSDPRVFADFMSTTPQVDVIVLAGWSWKIQAAIVERYPCIGLHPSDLPKYRGGSPLQHQIIDGVTETQCSLFQLSQEFDEGPVLAKAPMSLAGNMHDIFNELIRVGAELLNRSFLDWPNWHPEKQDNTLGFVRKRRKMEQSRLEPNMFQTHSLEDLYNIIRALGDPYPNAYIEDEKGNRMLFKEVAFIPGNPGALTVKGNQ